MTCTLFFLQFHPRDKTRMKTRRFQYDVFFAIKKPSGVRRAVCLILFYTQIKIISSAKSGGLDS